MINLTITNATITAGSTALLAHASLHVAAGLDPLRLPARRLRELRNAAPTWIKIPARHYHLGILCDRSCARGHHYRMHRC
ncbi:hypothetical protein [Corynebacterium rouxii]|uniref:hypothetical protein n=1 Tax=Corynebacterium rouxii TaxID=2719119 RepID=UPI00313BE3F7